eukprot:gene24753-32236_t
MSCHDNAIIVTSVNLLNEKERLILFLTELLDRSTNKEIPDAEKNQIDNKILQEYNTLLLKLRQFKQLDISRIKLLQSIARGALSEGYITNPAELHCLIDNVQLPSIDSKIRSEDEEEGHCKSATINYINQLSASGESTHRNVDEKSTNPIINSRDSQHQHIQLDDSKMLKDPFNMNDLQLQYDELFELVEARIGMSFHSLKHLSHSDTMISSPRDIFEEVDSDLEASGLIVENLKRLMGPTGDHYDSTAMSLSIPEQDSVANDVALRLFQSLYHQSYDSSWIENDRDEDIVAELLEGLRAKHRTVLRKTATLCEPYSPYQIHFKN